MDKSIIVVGAGIAGLSAGCYARMNGYKTTIFELHTIPGGLCTAWKRKGYTFDISMHLVTGSIKGAHHEMWNELGVTDSIKFHVHDHYAMIDGGDKKLLYYTDQKQVEDKMMAISPSDERRIRKFIKMIFGPDILDAASLKPAEISSLTDRMKVIPKILPLVKYFFTESKKTLQEFAAGFNDPFLKDAVRFIADGPGWPMPQYPMIALAGFINSTVKKSGVPLGGSQSVAYKIADLFEKTGGEFRYKSYVSDLVIIDNAVKGIRLNDGSEHFADFVIWAGDGHTLLFDILKGKYQDERIKNMYETWIPVKPIVHVMIGVNLDFSGEPHRTIFRPNKVEMIAGEKREWLCMLHHSFDTSMAPHGKSVVEVWYDSDYEYWEKLYADKEKYKAEKQNIADYTISELEIRYPGFKNQIEVVDVPTPMTYKRYTDNWKGSPDGWYLTNNNLTPGESFHRLPSLENLYTAGQWTGPYTGTVIAALSGRQAIELICHGEKKKFNTNSLIHSD
jgi:phytoene dehydrogenase-like protein